MVTKQGEKKKWVVRCYGGSEFDNERDAHELKNVLNALAEDGYDVHTLDLINKRVIGFLREESPLFSLLKAGPKSEPKSDPKELSLPEDPVVSYNATSHLGKVLIDNLVGVMDLRASGDPHTEVRVDKIINHLLKGVSLNEAGVLVEDVERLTTLHKEYAAASSSDKKPCGNSCVVNLVLSMASSKIRAYLAKNPLS